MSGAPTQMTGGVGAGMVPRETLPVMPPPIVNDAVPPPSNNLISGLVRSGGPTPIPGMRMPMAPPPGINPNAMGMLNPAMLNAINKPQIGPETDGGTPPPTSQSYRSAGLGPIASSVAAGAVPRRPINRKPVAPANPFGIGGGLGMY